IAGRARKTRQREPLEQPLEAPLWTPAEIAGECELLRTDLSVPSAVGVDRGKTARRLVRAARPELHVVEVIEPVAVAEQRLANPGERLLALQRAQIRGEEADPRRLLDVTRGQR